MQGILITGATGFIGHALASRLSELGLHVRGTRFRRAAVETVRPMEWCDVGSIGADTEWDDALRGVATVIHTAGRAHVMDDSKKGADLTYEINVNGTLRLARSAANRGVKRLIFLSSLGVIGTRTDGQPFTESTPADPQGQYARSKLLAETGLREIAAQTGLEVVIIRPPLVYGPNAPGNFRRLVHLVRTRIPLPLGSVRNARSLIAVENLVDILRLCVESPTVANEAFLVSDGDDVSTPDLLRFIARGLDVNLRLIPVPPGLLRLAGRITGRLDEVEKLSRSLQVDSGKIRGRLDWHPRVSASEGIVSAARSFAEGGLHV